MVYKESKKENHKHIIQDPNKAREWIIYGSLKLK
jgi:hypothetical protein